MTPQDLKNLVDIIKDNRTPCERDGHNYSFTSGATKDILYCTKCGDTKVLPDSKTIGLR